MKIITAQEAAGLIADGSTVAIGGFGAYGCPDQLLDAVVQRHRTCGHPAALTVFTGIGTGNNTDDNVGLNRLCDDGLMETLIAAHLANCPKIGRMVGENRLAAYVLPLGVVAHLLRAIAGKQPGVLTHVGLGTFADATQDACRANDRARAQGRTVVERIDVGGKQQLFYPAFPVDACLIRATYADEDGCLSFDHEALTGLELEMALAVHNSGGKVFAQVEDVVARGSLHPKKVRIHHTLVDYVIKASPEFHTQSYATPRYRPELSGEIRIPTAAIEPLPLDIRKVIARRGAMELRDGMVMNLGIGIPSGVGAVANEEGIAHTTLSLESGPIGGVPVAGVGFAAAVNPQSIMSLSETFDFYDGGGLNMTCLGAAEIDRNGNVNVSSFNRRCTGPGGFINISQSTPKVYFMCAFTAGKTEIQVGDGKLSIRKDGAGVKFVEKVQQVTFSADYARQTGQEVLYITERAVFRLTDGGIQLVELAPGADLQRDVLDQMGFRPLIAPELRTMDSRLFQERPMGIKFENSKEELS